MNFAYVHQNGGIITLYSKRGLILKTIENQSGAIYGHGKDFIVINDENSYRFVDSLGNTLHTYSKEIGQIVDVGKNFVTMREDNRLVRYDKFGIIRDSVGIVAEKEKDTIQKIANISQKFITLLIILNALATGAITYLDDDSLAEYILRIFCDVSILIFIIEIVIRIVYGGKEFFRGDEAGWNWFDLIVTIVSSLSFFKGIEGIVSTRTIRILREFRLLRVISGSANMKRIFHALLYALPQITWAGVFFVLLFYIYGIIGVELFRTTSENFASLHRTFLTLLQIMTFDDWMALTTEVMEEREWAWLYFVSFLILAAYILVNLLVGIVVDSLNEVREREEIDSNDISREIVKLEQQLDSVKKILKQDGNN